MAANHVKVASVIGTSLSLTVYAALFASTPIAFQQIMLSNGTNANVTVSVGAAGSEVDTWVIPAGGCKIVPLPIGQVPVGSRLSLLAAGAVPTSGYFSAALL